MVIAGRAVGRRGTRLQSDFFSYLKKTVGFGGGRGGGERAVDMKKKGAEGEAGARASVSTVETPGPVSLI